MFANAVLPTKIGAVTWGGLVLHDCAGIHAPVHVIFRSQRFSLGLMTKCSKCIENLYGQNRAVQPWDAFLNYVTLSSSSETSALCWIPILAPLKTLLTACSQSL